MRKKGEERQSEVRHEDKSGGGNVCPESLLQLYTVRAKRGKKGDLFPHTIKKKKGGILFSGKTNSYFSFPTKTLRWEMAMEKYNHLLAGEKVGERRDLIIYISVEGGVGSGIGRKDRPSRTVAQEENRGETLFEPPER